MKRFGFTLTEVLVTLGIIGVIAALTTPALVQDVGSAKVGPSLAKFVNTFETGMQNLMREHEVYDLSQTDDAWNASDADGLNSLTKYIVMTEIPKSQASHYNIYTPDGSKKADIKINKLYQLKDGSIVAQIPGNYVDVGKQWANPQGNFKEKVAGIIYDINGIKGNNRAGKEVFMFIVDSSGMLVPYESNMYVSLGRISSLDPTNCSLSSESVWSGFACTGAYADSGWTSIDD